MAVTIRARVVGVRPRGDDTFGVTLGPAPHMYWLRTSEPPALGDMLLVENAEATRLSVGGHNGAKITLLEGGDLRVLPDRYQRREVADRWRYMAAGQVTLNMFPFQAEGSGWIASCLAGGRGAILGDDPGLGKTVQVLAAIAAIGCTPAIIVCPPSVKRNWAREIAFLRTDMRVAVISGGTGPVPPAHFVILNYALMRPREYQLGQLGAKCIVFDEAHLLKEPLPPRGHRALVATRLAHKIGRPILMTGTPLLNRPAELWRLLYIVDPKRWSNFHQFRNRYCTKPRDKERTLKSVVTTHGKAKNVDELRSLTMPYLLRRTRTGTLREQIPNKHRKRVLVELSEFDRENYDRAERDVVEWLKKVSTTERARQASRGKAVVKLTMLRRIAAVGKMRSAVPDYVSTWFREHKKPLVIFAYHRQVLEGTRDICEKLKLNVATIRGSDSDKARQKAVDMFQNGFADVFIAPIKSAGVGLNLQRASDVLCLERLWTPSLMNQAESRCHRLGQKNDVNVVYLDAANTVDEHMAGVLEAKQTLIDRVVDDKSPRAIRKQTIETIEEVIAKIKGE